MQSWNLGTPDMKRADLKEAVAKCEGLPDQVAAMINAELEALPASRVANITANGRNDGDGLIEFSVSIDARKRG